MKSLTPILLCVFASNLLAAPSKIDNIDLEVTRIRKEISQIQQSTVSRETKIQKQRALIESEMKRALEQLRELEADGKKSAANKAESESPRDHQKTARDNLNKFLDILRSMNPKV